MIVTTMRIRVQQYVQVYKTVVQRVLRSDTCMGVVKCDMAQVCVLWREFAVCIVIVTRDVCCVGVIHTALCVVVECCA